MIALASGHRDAAQTVPHRRAGMEAACDDPLERLNKEFKRRNNVVGIFPNDAATLRLVGSQLLQGHHGQQPRAEGPA